MAVGGGLAVVLLNGLLRLGVAEDDEDQGGESS